MKPAFDPALDTVHLDFETRSAAPFGAGKEAVSVHQYARHPTTGILCMSWAINDQPVRLWDAWAGEAFPDDMIHALRHGAVFAAHNAGFEWEIWNGILVPRLGLPPLPIEQMDCTAARAAIMALPRSLEGAAAALGLEVQKDKEGSRLMLQMAKPRKPRKGEDPDALLWWDDEDRRTRLGQYCVTDTAVERDLDGVLAPMTAQEHQVWLLDHKTNKHGVCIDTRFVEKARRVMVAVSDGYKQRLADITNGAVTAPTQVAQMKAWAAERGVEFESLDKGSVIRALEDPEVPESVKELLQLRQEAGKSSVAKLDRFRVLTGPDGYMRDNFLYHGANTGRLAGRGAQLQNLPSRGGLKWHQAQTVKDIVLETEDPEWAADRVELLFGSVPTAISSCLRSCIIAPEGKNVYVADFSNIEGRVAAWFGNEAWKEQAFRDYDAGTGPDLYKVTAGQILGITPGEVTGDQRQVVGKVPELALGFGGGAGAFESMARNYNVQLADYWPVVQQTLEARFISKALDNWDTFGHRSLMERRAWLTSEAIKLGWRARHPGIVGCWKAAEDAAVAALQNPGRWYPFSSGRCAFGAREYGGVMFLISRLPNGRRIYRAGAHLKSVEKFGRPRAEIRFMGVDSVTRKWTRMSTYGGDLFQSFVQATARDLMVAGWQQVENDGFTVVLSVHDEIGAEGDEERTLDEFIAGMTRMPAWAEGCPVAAAGYVAKAYRKD